ncbi:MAG: Na+/H+ antiporter subunit E [Burkholderiales bacterium]|nr:Na+/H+ antiporter subunit E [Opitutaceae bacterium]
MSKSAAPSTSNSWPARVVGFLAFGLHFSRELVLANISVAKSVLLQTRADLAPGFLTYPLTGLNRFEILMLTHSITLTPGTTSVSISADFTELVVHAFDARDPDGVRASIKNGLEIPLLAWTR